MEKGRERAVDARLLFPPRNYLSFKDFKLPDSSVVKNPPANVGDAGDKGSIPGLGGSPGKGNGNQLPYSCLENPMDRGAWRPTVHEVAKSWTLLK